MDVYLESVSYEKKKDQLGSPALVPSRGAAITAGVHVTDEVPSGWKLPGLGELISQSKHGPLWSLVRSQLVLAPLILRE